jgi:hypothetical protein
MQQQNGLSFPYPTEQLSPFLSPVKDHELNLGELNATKIINKIKAF